MLDDGDTAAGAMKLKRFVSVNLTNAYSGQLSSSPSAGGGDGGGSVIRSFALDDAMKVSKMVFLSHLYIEANILPRQARDKHRENSKKTTVFSHALDDAI
jgi:hypothetical protein